MDIKHVRTSLCLFLAAAVFKHMALDILVKIPCVDDPRNYSVTGPYWITQYICQGQVATLCRPEERFLSCGGCQRTCRDPVPQCDAVCRVGCYCPGDKVRSDNGTCVRLADCPPQSKEGLCGVCGNLCGAMQDLSYCCGVCLQLVDCPPQIMSYSAETTEPRPKQSCPPGEEYRFCEPCIRTCDNPNPICPAQCARGCFCAGDLVRNQQGRCVKLEECSKSANKTRRHETTTPDVIMNCDFNQVYKKCETCVKTCSDPKPDCPNSECRRGCFCKEGQVKAPDGKCVDLVNCPKAEETFGSHELVVEDCGPDEEFFSCGWCEASCSEPYPQCTQVCTRGCLCRPPLLRHHSGRCVERNKCLLQRCSDPNEEYTCGYGCEGRCDGRTCVLHHRRCSLRCRCKIGLLRNRNETCVTPDMCDAQTKGVAFNNTV